MLGVGLLLTFVSSPQALANDPPHCASIHLDVTLEGDGDLWVTETQTCLVEEKHAKTLYRSISFDHGGILRSESTNPIESEQHEVSDIQTIERKYRIAGGLQHRNQYSQLYLQDIWADSEIPINKGRITLQLPAALANQVSYIEATTNSNNVYVTSQQLTPTKLQFDLAGPLPPNESWDVRVVFPEAVLNLGMPIWQQIILGIMLMIFFLLYLIGLLSPLLAIGLFIFVVSRIFVGSTR
ncbi:MAG: DUF2207 domain-containing protein [Leptolyngbyaceae cyanobacterium MAG.088]|nr:DUF2207 domain-containing protein [Leptolyngbyaceae cyanobacterium MAG.088]